MNFKSNKKKTYVSIIVSFIITYLLLGMFLCVGAPFCGVGFEILLDMQSIILFIIVLAIVYSVWSFIQKKSN